MAERSLQHRDPDSKDDETLRREARVHLASEPALQLVAELVARLRELDLPWWTPVKLRERFGAVERLGWFRERSDIRQQITTSLTGLAPRAARRKTPDFQGALIDSVIDEGDITPRAFEAAFDPRDLAVYGPAAAYWQFFRESMPWDEDTPQHQEIVAWLLKALLADRSPFEGIGRTPILTPWDVRTAIDGRLWQTRIPLEVRVAIDNARLKQERERPGVPFHADGELAIAGPDVIAANIPPREILPVVQLAQKAMRFDAPRGAPKADAPKAAPAELSSGRNGAPAAPPGAAAAPAVGAPVSTPASAPASSGGASASKPAAPASPAGATAPGAAASGAPVSASAASAPASSGSAPVSSGSAPVSSGSAPVSSPISVSTDAGSAGKPAAGPAGAPASAAGSPSGGLPASVSSPPSGPAAAPRAPGSITPPSAIVTRPSPAAGASPGGDPARGRLPSDPGVLSTARASTPPAPPALPTARASTPPAPPPAPPAARASTPPPLPAPSAPRASTPPVASAASAAAGVESLDDLEEEDGDEDTGAESERTNPWSVSAAEKQADADQDDLDALEVPEGGKPSGKS
ncbi:hypothetical protein [Sorangium sp. So ce1024]|uniref:hypothetical protein n=1 Tax=unclassified Sorangium TaxID=2621164 RepID=UPI003F0C1DA7